MKPDSHADENNEYKVRSIYFDDMVNSALYEKLDGNVSKEKFRIRLYNNDPSYITLEKKVKQGYYSCKTSQQVSIEQCRSLLTGDIFNVPADDSLLSEFYAKASAKLLRPKVIVDYDREAYCYQLFNIRVTFDKNIASANYSIDLFGDFPTVPVMDNDLILMEVKYDKCLPEFIGTTLNSVPMINTAISKYAMCRNIQ